MTPRPVEPPWLVPPRGGLRVWALEPYYGGSHRQFLEGLQAHSTHEVTALTLPGRHWKWRMHGGALSLARQARERVAVSEPPQVLFASSMLDLATFLALAGAVVGAAPRLLYFHENQLTYPLPAGVERDLGYGVKQVAAALAAHRVLFNSQFHRGEFLQGVRGLLAAVPDEAPLWAAEVIEAKSAVLPVGCDLRRFDAYRPGAGGAIGSDREAGRPGSGRWGEPRNGPLIVWNQRWEYDKAPGDLFRGLYALQERGLPFRLALAGANQGLPAAEFVEARRRLADHVVQWGRVERFGDYADLLWQADIVVSTARHEFFGVAVVEALYCGCRPVLPRRLSYPEIVPPEAHRWALYEEGEFAAALEQAVRECSTPPADRWGRTEWQRTWVAPYDWGSVILRYDEEVWRCWETGAAAAPGLGE